MIEGTDSVQVSTFVDTGARDSRNNPIMSEDTRTLTGVLVSYKATASEYGASVFSTPDTSDITVYFSKSKNDWFYPDDNSIYDVNGIKYKQNGVPNVWNSPAGFMFEVNDIVVLNLKAWGSE